MLAKNYSSRTGKKRKIKDDSDDSDDSEYDPSKTEDLNLSSDDEDLETDDEGRFQVILNIPDFHEEIEPPCKEGSIKELNEQVKEFYKKNITFKRHDNDKPEKWTKYSDEELDKMKEFLLKLNNKNIHNEVNVIKILESKIDDSLKEELLKKFKQLCYYEPFSDEYSYFLEQISKELNEPEISSRLDLIKGYKPEDIKTQLLNSKMDEETLKIVYEKYEKLERGGSDSNKQRDWINSILKVPFGKLKKIPVSKTDSREDIKNFLQKVRSDLDENISYLENPKDEIINFVAKFIQNPESQSVNAISIYGSPGIGKTTLVREGIAKALNRPFVSIPLGGAKDSSFLLGHGYTYEGSNCGRIIDVLKQAKCMNPVIYFDELDKISDTPGGQEIISVLTHLIDPSQNSEFYDNYFMGIKFDLSHALFIFSYNNENILDSILSDRINKIKINNPGIKEKIEICKKHLIPKAMKDIGIKENDIIFSDSILKYMICNTRESGCREINRNITQIISKINTLDLCAGDPSIIKLKYNKIKIRFPVNVDQDMVRELLPNERKDEIYSMMYT